MANGDFEYDVAVSFAGEDRAMAERFSELLRAEGFSVFYDAWNKADLWGRNLYSHLADVYSKKARFCVMFLSASYAAKAWTRHEMDAAQTRAFRENEAYILPVRIDDTAIPGIGETVGYLDLRKETIEDVARIAVEKIKAARPNASRAESPSPHAAASPSAAPRLVTDLVRHQPPELSSATVAVITALDKEYAACRSILDPNNTGHERSATSAGGTLTCWLCYVTGRQGAHAVAILLLNDMGNNAAAAGTMLLLHHCPEVTHLIMSGIAGAVPYPQKPGDHVRLGDIVVSGPHGVVQYDFGKQRMQPPPQTESPSSPHASFEHRHRPRPPSSELLQSVNRLQSDVMLLTAKEPRLWELYADEFIATHDEKWERPSSVNDVLDDSPRGSTASPVEHPRDDTRRAGKPSVFVAAIGSGNSVQSDRLRRDFLRDRFAIKAVEMEGSGVAEAGWQAEVGYLLVRGTCDYCNDRKNDRWQWYAAVIAAAYTRVVIEYLPVAMTTTLVVPILQTHLSSDRSLAVQVPSGAPVSSSTPSPEATTQLVAPDHSPPAAHYTQIKTAHSFASPSSDDLAMQSSTMMEAHMRHLRAAVEASTSLSELLTRIRELKRNYRWHEAMPLARELEQRLTGAIQRGPLLQEAYLILAEIEQYRLQQQKLAGQPRDLTRLRQLIEEAARAIS